MGRIIKFRAQDENHCWHFGNYDQDNQEFFYTHTDADGCHKVNVPIIPDTVGQFTGFKDIDGKEIFEGDIVQNDEYPELVYSVRMINGRWCITMDHNYNSLSLCWLLEHSSQKVIGNIHDNPELLEVEK